LDDFKIFDDAPVIKIVLLIFIFYIINNEAKLERELLLLLIQKRGKA